jgi:hypothetical protein
MNRLLKLTAAIEESTGLGLLVVPYFVVQLLLGVPLETSGALTLGRIGGAALLAIGVACWLSRDDTQSRAAKGLVAALIVYNVLAVIVLGAAGIHSQAVGIVLWPAVVLHAVMTVWCVVDLRRANPRQK